MYYLKFPSLDFWIFLILFRPKGSCGLIVSYFGSFGILCCMSSYLGKCLEAHLVNVHVVFYYCCWFIFFFLILFYFFNFILSTFNTAYPEFQSSALCDTIVLPIGENEAAQNVPICHSQGNSKYSANKGKKLHMGMWKVLNSVFSSPLTYPDRDHIRS